MPDERASVDNSTAEKQCWSELQTAVRQLETSMNDLQDAVASLDRAFAAVETAARNQGEHSELTPTTVTDQKAVGDEVASD